MPLDARGAPRVSGLGEVLPSAGWRVDPVPSRLLAWRVEPDLPDPRALVDAASRSGIEIESVEMLEFGPPVAWAVVAHEAARPSWVLWCEPCGPSSAGEVPPSANASRWIVGIDTLIAMPDGFEHAAAATLARHRAMKRWLHEGGAVAALLDPATGRWLDAAEWRDDRGQDETASLEELWCVRVHRRPGASKVWLSTEGLVRCGRPELELLEIPESLAAPGAALLDDLAALLLEEAPSPETPWRIGPSIEVSLERLDEVLASLAASAPGSLEDRRRLDADAAIDAHRAVVCASERQGSYRRVPVPPIEAIERIARGEAGLYRSRHESERLRRIVSRQAPLLARIARAIDSGLGEFRARVAVASETEPGSSAWAELVGVAAEGWLVQPIDLAGRPVMTAPASIAALGSLGNWRVDRGERSFGPDDAALLEAELEDVERADDEGTKTP